MTPDAPKSTPSEAQAAHGLPTTPEGGYDRLTAREHAARNPNSRKLAINAMCWDCEGDTDPAIRWRIGNCVIKDCPLYRFRPHKMYEGRPMPEALK